MFLYETSNVWFLRLTKLTFLSLATHIWLFPECTCVTQTLECYRYLLLMVRTPFWIISLVKADHMRAQGMLQEQILVFSNGCSLHLIEQGYIFMYAE